MCLRTGRCGTPVASWQGNLEERSRLVPLHGVYACLLRDFPEPILVRTSVVRSGNPVGGRDGLCAECY